MKAIKNLKKGDRIIVSYQETSSVFVEAVKAVRIDGREFVINTNHEQNVAGREILRQEWPNHWPIRIPVVATAGNSHTFRAGKDVEGKITVADRADIDVICPPSDYDDL